LIVRAYDAGWRRFVAFACRGDRFIGCGLGARSDAVRIDVYGSSGDYLGSAWTARRFMCMATRRIKWDRS
jgi:hypothetical protein